MDIVLDNFLWMGANVALALIGVIFGWLFLYAQRPILSLISFILWTLFIPNTIYLVTDLAHLPKQWFKVDYISQIILLIQYGTLTVLGVITFIISMYPVDKVFTKLNIKRKTNLKFFILILVNFLIAFGLILGKFQRTHSWYVFTDFPRVLNDVLAVIQTPILAFSVLFFGVVLNLTYFGFKNYIHLKIRKN